MKEKKLIAFCRKKVSQLNTKQEKYLVRWKSETKSDRFKSDQCMYCIIFREKKINFSFFSSKHSLILLLLFQFRQRLNPCSSIHYYNFFSPKKNKVNIFDLAKRLHHSAYVYADKHIALSHNTQITKKPIQFKFDKSMITSIIISYSFIECVCYFLCVVILLRIIII